MPCCAQTGPARAAARALNPPATGTATRTVTTTSRPSTAQSASARIRWATLLAHAQAVTGPAGKRDAAASAARSAAACARCRATTTDPSVAPPPVTESSTATIAAATTVAEPRSSAGFGRHNPLRRNDHRRQQPGPHGDRGDDDGAVTAQLHLRPTGRDAPGHVDCRALVTAGRQPGCFAGGIHTAHLHRHRADTGQAQDQHGNQSRNPQRRFDGARAGIRGETRYALVFNARAMMLVSAETIESPVTTV